MMATNTESNALVETEGEPVESAEPTVERMVFLGYWLNG